MNIANKTYLKTKCPYTGLIKKTKLIMATTNGITAYSVKTKTKNVPNQEDTLQQEKTVLVTKWPQLWARRLQKSI
jgi:hypothetical protein